MSLSLFVIEDYVPRLSDQALLIKEFKALYTLGYNKRLGDTQGRDRKRAIQECSFIYHCYDYRSEYSEYGEKERYKEALIAANLPEDYKFSPEFTACIDIFLSLQDTRMLKTLGVAEETLDKIRLYYQSVDFSEKDDKGALVHNPKNIMASIADLGNVNKKLSDLRKQVKAELKDTESLRGDHEGGFDGAE